MKITKCAVGDRVVLISGYYGVPAGAVGEFTAVGSQYVSFQPDGSPRVFSGMDPARFKPEEPLDNSSVTHEPIRISVVTVPSGGILFQGFARVEQIEPGTFVITEVKDQSICRSLLWWDKAYRRCEMYEGHLVDAAPHASKGMSWADAEADGTINERER